MEKAAHDERLFFGNRKANENKGNRTGFCLLWMTGLK